MRNVSCLIWLVRLCILPTPTPDDAGDASFLGPSRAPTQKADMGSRARTPKGPKINGKKARAAHASQPQQKQNGQNNSPTLSTAVFGGIYSIL